MWHRANLYVSQRGYGGEKRRKKLKRLFSASPFLHFTFSNQRSCVRTLRNWAAGWIIALNFYLAAKLGSFAQNCETPVVFWGKWLVCRLSRWLILKLDSRASWHFWSNSFHFWRLHFLFRSICVMTRSLQYYILCHLLLLSVFMHYYVWYARYTYFFYRGENPKSNELWWESISFNRVFFSAYCLLFHHCLAPIAHRFK